MRRAYLDNIRWVTVVLVVFYHVVYMYNAEGIPGVVGQITKAPVFYVDIYQYLVYPWFMMLLFIVSGICSRYYLERHTEREFLKSRTTRLLVPSTIGLFAFQFIQGYVNMSMSHAFDTLENVPVVVLYLIEVLSGVGVLWYVQMLWVFSVFLIPIRRAEKDRLWKAGARMPVLGLIFMAILVWASAQLLNTPIIAVYRFGLYGMVFLLGYFVFSHDVVIETVKKWFLPFLAVALVLGVSFTWVYFGGNYADAPINRSWLYTSFAWFASLAVLGGMARYGDFENGFTRWMSRHSFGLYVFHYLGISAVGLLIAKAGVLPAPLVYFLSLLSGFVAGYLLYAIISRIPFFRWAVLGIKKKG